GNLRSLALRGHPLCSVWSSSVASSPMRYKSPRDNSCRSLLPHTWKLQGKAHWPLVRWRIERSYPRLSEPFARKQRRRRRETRSTGGDLTVLVSPSDNYGWGRCGTRDFHGRQGLQKR